VETLLEEADEVRGVGKGAVVADLGHCLIARVEKGLSKLQSLLDKPLMGRGGEGLCKLLLKGCQRAVCLLHNICT